MPTVRPQLKDFDIPVENCFITRPDPYAKVVVLTKLLSYLREPRHHPESTNGVTVEDKHSPIAQVLVHTVEKTLPGCEVEQVIDTVIDTNYGIEFHVQLKAAHICHVERRSLGQFLASHSQHTGRDIQAGH